MAPLSFAERVVSLEKQMTSLQQLPKKVDDLALQVSQLHAEMTREFSAIRDEMAADAAAVRAEMVTEFAAVRADLAEGDAETRRQMRVLHEDLAGRIALLQVGLPPAKARRPKRRRR